MSSITEIVDKIKDTRTSLESALKANEEIYSLIFKDVSDKLTIQPEEPNTEEQGIDEKEPCDGDICPKCNRVIQIINV